VRGRGVREEDTDEGRDRVRVEGGGVRQWRERQK